MPVDVLDHRAGVFDRDDELASAGHEQTVFCRDDVTGLRAIISIHDTSRGPALGGTRFYPYACESDAVTDVLRLARGMTFKAAAAGMPLGGGKAVIIGDPAAIKTPALLRSYGRFIERLGGLYVTAADVGTTSDDLDVVGQETRYVVGRNEAVGGTGDSGLSTATGVLHAMQAAAESVWGADGLQGRAVGVEGAGKVGMHLARLLIERGASVVVSDPSEVAVQRLTRLLGGRVSFLPSVADADVDIYAPCALGGTLTPEAVARLRASVVCGAANNQLLTADVAELLEGRGITWVPDYVANAGGLIQVGGEFLGRGSAEIRDDVRTIGVTTREVLASARREGIAPSTAAERIVSRRLQASHPRA